MVWHSIRKVTREVAFEDIIRIHLTTGEFQLHSSVVPHRQKNLICFRFVCTYKFKPMSFLHWFIKLIEEIESQNHRNVLVERDL